MKLAIGSGVAFHDHMSERNASGEVLLYADPKSAAGRLRWWKKQGVEGIVFYDAMPDFYRVPMDRWKAIKAVLDDVGLPAAAFNTLRKSLFMPELADYDDKRMYHCLAVCEILRPSIYDLSVNVPIRTGQDPIVNAGRDMFRGEYASHEDYARAVSYLKPFTKALASIGASLSIELHDDGLQDTADGCLRLARMIDEPNVGTNPDIGNWYRVPYAHPDSWWDQMVKLAPSTNYWEVKNYKRFLSPGENRAFSWNVDLDDGDLDFRSSAVLLWKHGFRGWVCSEGGNGDHVHSTLKYLRYMRWILDEWIPNLGQA